MKCKTFMLHVAIVCLFSVALNCKSEEKKETTDGIITLRPTERIHIGNGNGYLVYGGYFYTNHATFFYLTGIYNQAVYKFEKDKRIYFNRKYITLYSINDKHIKLYIDQDLKIKEKAE